MAHNAGLERPPDRTIAFSGLITSVHAAIIDVIPRICHFMKQVHHARGPAPLAPRPLHVPPPSCPPCCPPSLAPH